MAQEEETELAVFRFTLGIPGVDDAVIPRVVGLAGAALLWANHAFSVAPSAAQDRAEWLGVLLCAASVVVPSLDERLNEATRGVKSGGAAGVAGGASLFALRDGLTEAQRQELAWATFAILRNTNACGVLAVKRGVAWCVRGTVRTDGGEAAEALTALDAQLTGAAWATLTAADGVYLNDARQLSGAGVSGWGFVPSGVASVLACPMAGDPTVGTLVLLGAQPRAFSPKERKWAQALADKLAPL